MKSDTGWLLPRGLHVLRRVCPRFSAMSVVVSGMKRGTEWSIGTYFAGKESFMRN